MTNVVKKNGVNFGLIVGIIAILATAIMYSVDIKLFANMWVGIIILFLNIILGIVAVVKTKKALTGIISFKEAFTVFFIVMAIGAAMSTIFMFVLFNLIDPEAKSTITEVIIENTVGWMQNMGAKTADIKKTVEDMRSSDNFGAVSQIKSYFGILVLYIIIGLIVAAAFKSKAKAEF
jgi:predicted membrane protein